MIPNVRAEIERGTTLRQLRDDILQQLELGSLVPAEDVDVVADVIEGEDGQPGVGCDVLLRDVVKVPDSHGSHQRIAEILEEVHRAGHLSWKKLGSLAALSAGPIVRASARGNLR